VGPAKKKGASKQMNSGVPVVRVWKYQPKISSREAEHPLWNEENYHIARNDILQE